MPHEDRLSQYRARPNSIRDFTLQNCIRFQELSAQSARQAQIPGLAPDLVIMEQRNAAAYHREMAYRLDQLIGV